jgi:hypothetical protein
MRQCWIALAVVVAVGANAAFIAKQPAASAQTKVIGVARPDTPVAEAKVIETVVPRRYQLTMTGSGNSFIVIDTATGRCWISSPDKREWQDIGAPPIPRPVLPIAPPPPIEPPKK